MPRRDRGPGDCYARAVSWGSGGSPPSSAICAACFKYAAGSTPAKRDDVSVVDEAVADRVRDCRFPDCLVPTLRRKLRRDHRGRLVVPIFEHLEQVTSLHLGHRHEKEVVEDEDGDLSHAGELLGVGPVGARDREPLEQTRRADAERAEALTTSRLRERAAEERLSDAGGAEHDHVLFPSYPLAGRKRARQGLVDAACWIARVAARTGWRRLHRDG